MELRDNRSYSLLRTLQPLLRVQANAQCSLAAQSRRRIRYVCPSKRQEDFIAGRE